MVFSPQDGSRIGRGEPLVEYVDTKFGDGNGTLDRAEWNAWAHSFQDRLAYVVAADTDALTAGRCAEAALASLTASIAPAVLLHRSGADRRSMTR